MGWSERPGEPRTLAQRVDDLGRLTDALGVTGPVVTVGHDWGGAISPGLGARAPRPAARRGADQHRRRQPAGDRGPVLIRLAHVPVLRGPPACAPPTFVRATTRAVAARRCRPTCDDALRGPVPSAGAAPGGRRLRGRHPVRPRTTRRARRCDAIADGVRDLDVPALLLWGPRDPVFGERYLADLRDRLPQAQLHRYEGASHLVTEDAPQYADAVARWVHDLRRRPGRRPPRRPATPTGADAALVGADRARRRRLPRRRRGRRARPSAGRRCAAGSETSPRGWRAAGVRPGRPGRAAGRAVGRPDRRASTPCGGPAR